MKSISLYTLVEQYRALEQLDLESIDEQALKDTLEGLQGDITIKATNVGAFVLNVEAYAQAAKEAAKKLDERAKRMQRRADAMREYLREAMKAVDMKKIESEMFTLTRKNNPPSINILDAEAVPDTFRHPPDPIISLIVQAVSELPRDIEATLSETPLEQVVETYLLVTHTELAECIERHLPPRQPNKKAIGEAIKAGVEIKWAESVPSERLEIKS